MDICYSTNQNKSTTKKMVKPHFEEEWFKDGSYLQGTNQFHMGNWIAKLYLEDLLSLNVPTQGDEMLLESESKTGDLIPEEW